MRRITVIAVIACAVICASCKSRSTPPPVMSQPDVKAKLLKISGLDVPDTATNVSGTEMSMFTYVFDCNFECPLNDLKNAWQNAPRLIDKVTIAELVPGEDRPKEVFEGKWSAQGGTQFVNIAIGKLDDERVRVEIRTTQEDNEPNKSRQRK